MEAIKFTKKAIEDLPVTEKDYVKHDSRDVVRRPLANLREDKDPAAQKPEAQEAPTIAALTEMRMKRRVPTKKKSSEDEDRRQWNGHITPRLGKRPVRDIDWKDVRLLHSEVTDSGMAVWLLPRKRKRGLQGRVAYRVCLWRASFCSRVAESGRPSRQGGSGSIPRTGNGLKRRLELALSC